MHIYIYYVFVNDMSFIGDAAGPGALRREPGPGRGRPAGAGGGSITPIITTISCDYY